MTKDEIIEMAKQADALSAARVNWDFEWVETFAQLVAAKEREACAKLVERNYSETIADKIRARGEA